MLWMLASGPVEDKAALWERVPEAAPSLCTAPLRLHDVDVHEILTP